MSRRSPPRRATWRPDVPRCWPGSSAGRASLGRVGNRGTSSGAGGFWQSAEHAAVEHQIGVPAISSSRARDQSCARIARMKANTAGENRRPAIEINETTRTTSGSLTG
jgi:hypothetical protein